MVSMLHVETDDSVERDPLFDAEVHVDEVRFVGAKDMTFRELFGGYDTLRAITFSMETGFLDRITELFEYSECIIGASYMARKNRSIFDSYFYAFAHAGLALDETVKYPGLVLRLRDGRIKLKASNMILDHRKRYILSGPSGTRVVTASANMSGRAWTGDQAEHYMYDDSSAAYDAAMREFEAAWACCGDIPYRVLAESGKRDDILDNPLVKNMINVNNMAVVPAEDPVIMREIVEYTLLADERYEEYRKVLEPQLKKAKMQDGHYVISYKALQKASAELKSARQKIEVQRVKRDYPYMTFDYSSDAPGMTLMGKPVDISFDEDAARQDGALILQAFSHFEDGREFIGDLDGLRDGYWRVMCYMFGSPHIGYMKYSARVCDLDPMSLPLYLILGSKGPDTGKTFMTRLLLAAMTGKHNIRFEKGSAKGGNGSDDTFIGKMRAVQAIHDCVPFVYDELVSSTVRSVKNLLREFDASDLRETTPALVFTTNDLLDPDSLVRKRALYIPFDAAIRSSVDKNEFKSVGDQMIRSFTGAFYREFTRRYIPKVVEIVDTMYDMGRPDGWYPDFVSCVSEVILGLFHDLGLQPYDYMRPLVWNRDFYADNKNAESACRMINNMYDMDPDKFRVTNHTVKIYFGTDSSGQKRAAGLANMLPADVQATTETYRDEGAILTFNRREAEDLGLVFRRRFFDRFRR